MGSKRVIVEHNGVEWNSLKLAQRGNWTMHYAWELLRDVNAGDRTMSEVLEHAVRKRKKNGSRLHRPFKFKTTTGDVTWTAAEVVRLTGLTLCAAWRRLKKVENGKRPIETLFDPPRSKKSAKRSRKPKGRLSHFEDKMTPEREENFSLLERVDNINELLRARELLAAGKGRQH